MQTIRALHVVLAHLAAQLVLVGAWVHLVPVVIVGIVGTFVATTYLWASGRPVEYDEESLVPMVPTAGVPR